MKPNQWLVKLAALLLAACAYPAGVAFADEGAEPAVDETPVDVGVVEEGEVMPEDWIYMTGAPVEGEVADGDVAVDDGTVVLEDGTVVNFDGGEEVPAEELMYTTGVAGESASVSVSAPDYVDAAGISEVQLDSAYDGAVVQSEFEGSSESLAAPEVPAPSEGSAARIQGGRLVSAAPASK